MANHLPMEIKARIVAALAEGAAIRGVERMTGVHRDTIMRLGVAVGEGCAGLMDRRMRDLSCTDVQVDELWGFVFKKQRNLREADPEGFGDAWVFSAIDGPTKLVPAYLVGKRDAWTARAFIEDLAGRLANRIQLSSDALAAYIDAVERGFGGEVDYGQIVKTFSVTEIEPGRYSPPECVGTRKSAVVGFPTPERISTSYVEKQNHTVRMHCRRLARLTNAYSKKLRHLEAAVALHYAYYNFVRFHRAIRMTPAMAAGVVPGPWTVRDLIGEALRPWP